MHQGQSSNQSVKSADRDATIDRDPQRAKRKRDRPSHLIHPSHPTVAERYGGKREPSRAHHAQRAVRTQRDQYHAGKTPHNASLSTPSIASGQSFPIPQRHYVRSHISHPSIPPPVHATTQTQLQPVGYAHAMAHTHADHGAGTCKRVRTNQ